eukprot:1160626-Pelagomonas_calceolata.AAC.6
MTRTKCTRAYIPQRGPHSWRSSHAVCHRRSPAAQPAVNALQDLLHRDPPHQYNHSSATLCGIEGVQQRSLQSLLQGPATWVQTDFPVCVGSDGLDIVREHKADVVTHSRSPLPIKWRERMLYTACSSEGTQVCKLPSALTLAMQGVGATRGLREKELQGMRVQWEGVSEECNHPQASTRSGLAL